MDVGGLVDIGGLAVVGVLVVEDVKSKDHSHIYERWSSPEHSK